MQGESNSITNQKETREEYAWERGFTRIRHFTDDGISGTRFDRPGFVALMKEIEEGDDALAEYGEIYAIYVLADYHGKKVGYELMNAAFDKLSDYKKIAVWVLKGNDKAIRFYERFGFRFDGIEQEITLGTSKRRIKNDLREGINDAEKRACLSNNYMIISKIG